MVVSGLFSGSSCLISPTYCDNYHYMSRHDFYCVLSAKWLILQPGLLESGSNKRENSKT